MSILKSTMMAAIGAAVLGFNANAQVQVGIRAGANFSNLSIKDNDKKVEGTMLTPGFNIGLTFDIPVAYEFSIQPGALFTTKGSKLTGNSIHWFNPDAVTTTGYTRLTASYLEVPINFIYKPAMGNGNMLLGGGPYFAYGVGGKYKDDPQDGSDVTTGKLVYVNDWNNAPAPTSSDQVYGKKADAGLNLLAGYEFANKFSMQLNAQLGLTNIDPKDNGSATGIKQKNVGFGVSFGYKF